MNNRSLKNITVNVLSLLVLLVIAFSWLIFPYAIQGDDLLFETGEQVRGERFENFNLLSGILTRDMEFSDGTSVSALYVSDEYIEYTGQGGGMDVYRTGENIVFILDEENSNGNLPDGVPETVLTVAGQRYLPVAVEGPEQAVHHRRSVISFSRVNTGNQVILTDDIDVLELGLADAVQRYGLSGNPAGAGPSWSWELPLQIPDNMKSSHVLNKTMLFSLSAGLLSSILTPCLMQLVLVLFATLGGVSVREVIESGTITPTIQRRIMWKFVFFILVFISLFMVIGAMTGYLGKEAQILFADYNKAAGGLAGAVMVLFGLWIGIRSQVPLMCRLPGAAMAEKMRNMGIVGTLVVSMALSIGCMSCYGGYIMGALLIYIGTLDSAVNGAIVLGLFASGVAIPFLVASISFSRMQNMFEFINRHSKVVGAVCSIMILGFGLSLATNNYHVVSDFFYPYLGLD